MASMKVEVTSSVGSFHGLLEGNQSSKLPEVRPRLARLLKAHLRMIILRKMSIALIDFIRSFQLAP